MPSTFKLTSRSYKNGLSGDHSLAFGIRMRRSASAGPLTVPTTVSPSFTSLSTMTSPIFGLFVVAVARSVSASMSGTSFRSRIASGATGSNHTVCQMPVLGV